MVNMVNHPKKDIRIISKPGHRCGFQHGGVVQRQVFTLQQRLQTTSRKAEVPGVLWDMCAKNWSSISESCASSSINMELLQTNVELKQKRLEIPVCWFADTLYIEGSVWYLRHPPTNYLWESGCPSTRQLGCTIRDQNSWAKLTWIMFRKYQAIFQVKCQTNTTINRCYCAKLPLV